MATKMTSVRRAEGQDASESGRALRRVTGVVGLASLPLIFIPGLAGSAQEPGFIGSSEQILAYFASVDTAMGSLGSFSQALGVIAFVWFAVGLAVLGRVKEAEPRWRSTVAGASAGVFAAVALGGSWTAATLRASTLDPDTARFAFDLGNASFANSWLALGSFGVAAGVLILSSWLLPRWLGWWAIATGAGLVLSRAAWTSEIWLLPYLLFWLWVATVAVLLLRRGHVAPEAAAVG